MAPVAIETLASNLLAGELPDAQPWTIAAAVVWIADAIGRRDPAITAPAVRLAAGVLKANRLFEHTRLLGQTWRDVQGFDATITKHHAQAVIELSALDAAEQVLRDALTAVNIPGARAQEMAERLEYEGLLGRVAKQRFVVSGDLNALQEATDRYLLQYQQPKKPYWHGINAVALAAREVREGIDRANGIDYESIAKTIFDHVAKKYSEDPSDEWLAATASEAMLALGQCDMAEFWLYRFLNHPKVRPFHVNSYDRQLREIWGGTLAGSRCADRLVGITAGHVFRTQSRVTINPSEVNEAGRVHSGELEKNFSNETGFSIDNVKRLLAACASIGCVTNAAGERLGTGFLVDGAGLKGGFGPGPVFVTNAHVISTTVPNAIRPADARVTFEVESATAGNPVAYKVDESLLFTSPPGDLGVYGDGNTLDVTIVRLRELPAGFSSLVSSMTLPLVDAKAKAYVVGHPRGSGLLIALHDSVLLDIDDYDCLVHYRTPTDPGSSGSPVFNKDWEVIALHHAGSTKARRLHGEGSYEANEGISLSSIRRKLNA